MLKFSFKVFILITAVIILISPIYTIPVMAAENGYSISAYGINVKVREDNVLDIAETITADFYVPKHGIFRYIPVVIYSQDNSKKYRITVTDISVTDKAGNYIKYKSERDGDYLLIRIGDEDVSFSGVETYIFKYSYGIGYDGIKDYDQLYYSLIGTGWDTTIDNVTFSIDMPKEFNQGNLSFYCGPEGTTLSSGVSFKVTGNKITGSADRQLNPGEALTVKIDLPEQYFSEAAQKGTNISLIIFFISLGAAGLLLFFLFGRDDKVYPTVEVRPPEDLTSAEAGYIIDNYIDDRDIVSLIIYWADKGYLSISGDEKEFILTKMKNADNNMKPYEKFMFDKLFEKDVSVTADDLKYKFHDTLTATKQMITDSFDVPDKRLFTRQSKLAKMLCYFLAGVAMGIVVGMAFAEYQYDFGSGFLAGVISAVITMLLASLVGYAVDKSKAGSKVMVVLSVIFYAACLLIVLFLVSGISEARVEYITGTIAAFITGFIGSYAKKRTAHSNLWLGKLIGLKKFITMAEKERIILLVKDNPSLFYNILPYAYALGVTDEWSKQFESIALEPPSWYSGHYNTFNIIYFGSLIGRNMNSFQTNMSSIPPKGSGSGGFGGGGFSGGGFGGGGGGSW